MGLCFILMISVLYRLIKAFYQTDKIKTKIMMSVRSTSQISSKPPSSPSTSSVISAKPSDDEIEISPFFKITSLFCIGSFTVAVGIDVVVGIYYFSTGIDVFHTDQYVFGFTNLFLATATTTLYVFIFGRLHKTFKDSTFQLRAVTFWSITILINLNMMAQISVVICYFMFPLYFTLDEFHVYLNALNVFLLAFDFLLNSVVLSVFIYKLQQLLISLEHDGIPIDFIGIVDININDIELNNAQIKMLSIITKHAILSSFAIVFNMLYYISVIIGSNIKTVYMADLYFLGYSHLVKALHGGVVAFTLYLNFKFNDVLYSKICKKYHSFCYRRFETKTKREIFTKKVSIDPKKTSEIEMSVV